MLICDLRRDYSLSKLEESQIDLDPFNQFEKWFQEAVSADIKEANAMTLASVDKNYRPSTRIVLLKGYDKNGLVFYTNYSSRKGRELQANPNIALQFYWAELERAIRIEGVANKTSSSESDAYFYSRPLQSRIGAWASPQSEVIPDRAFLDQNIMNYSLKFDSKTQAKYASDAVPRPENWGGYRVQPYEWEFWQGRENRLHDRLRYRLQNKSNSTTSENSLWHLERLAP